MGAGPKETVIVNNRRNFVIRVIRDKIRVLQVVGRPSWDERFLRKLLKKNPNVDLISFFILRTSSSIQVARRNEMSLIPFPTQELFEDQLGSFDLIIFQNFTYRGYQMRRYLPLIKRYVNKGGGFVMTGGDISFADGGYGGTAIEDFLPVTLSGVSKSTPSNVPFSPKLTAAGRFHPITALSFTPDENDKIWRDLPQLVGLNRIGKVRSDAVVLLEHPSEQAGGSNVPVVAVRNFGQGRVLSIFTDTTWRWDFKSFGQGQDNRNYYKFWGNAIRWLIRDPELKTIRVRTDKDRYAVGEQVTVTVRLQGYDYRPAVGKSLVVRVTERGQKENGVADTTSKKGITDSAGRFTFVLDAGGEGVFDVEASAESNRRERQRCLRGCFRALRTGVYEDQPCLACILVKMGWGRCI